MEKDVIKHVDRAKIAKYKRDLAKYCELINNFVVVMKRNELIEALTPDICAQLVNQDFTPFKQNIINQYAEEAERHATTIMRKQYKNLAGKMLQEVSKVFDMFLQDVELAKRSLDLRLEIWERVPFITVENGKAVFNASAIERQYTHVYNSRIELEFIERTRRLHAEILLFNQDCKRMGGVGVGRNITDLIEVSGELDGIRINWEALDNLSI